jgi:hypothetical protein
MNQLKPQSFTCTCYSQKNMLISKNYMKKAAKCTKFFPSVSLWFYALYIIKSWSHFSPSLKYVFNQIHVVAFSDTRVNQLLLLESWLGFLGTKYNLKLDLSSGLSILDCPFLIAHSWLSILYCPFLIVHSRLSILKTWSLLQTIEGKDEPNIIIIQEKVWQIFLLEIQFRTGRYTYTLQCNLDISDRALLHTYTSM